MNRTISIASIAFLTAFALPSVASDVDFAREVLPILSNKCFVCHGPDAEESELRLDSEDSATTDRGGYRAINPDAPGESAVLARIHSTDDPMPPDDAEKQLTNQERDLISRWIMQGGGYAKHWAFVAPVKSTDHDGSTPAQIDDFIENRMADSEIEFAAEADKSTLARRVALVLTGLPPEPGQLQTFLSDHSDDAYQRYVDSMLDSPRYGEHQARYWLDAVRYGDTHGLHLDNKRGIFPYRDWVVKAFNDNLPINDFITWQLAGDLLPEPTLAQLTATGFVRLNPSTGEGGAIKEEFQAKNNFDRVENLGTVFLGMSLTCARCHTHKYDPIPQSEYYRLMAFFNSTSEPALDGNSYTYGPTQRVPSNQSEWQQWTELEALRERQLTKANQAIRDTNKEQLLVEFARAREKWNTESWMISKPVPINDPMPDQDVTGNVKNEKQKDDPNWSETNNLPGSIAGKRARSMMPTAGKAVWITAEVKLPTDQALLLTFSGARGSAIWIDNSPEPLAKKSSASRTEMTTLALSEGSHSLRFKVVGDRNTEEIQIRIENPWNALAKAKDWNQCSKRDQLWMLADPGGPLSDLTDHTSVAEVADKIRQLESNFTTTLVVDDLPEPRQTHLLRRGEYDMPEGDPLEPGILQVMGNFPPDAPPDRRGLAAWLTSSDHPLVARVLVNRIWQRTFGHALVRSPEDFGLQGQQPTHPELLDWLAVEMHESGWDLKHLLRLMITSRTFRQSSAHRSEIDDPENRLFARGPSYRLDAEVLRDIGLWASGLLDPTMGGEGVKPYQPSGMWMALAHPASNTKNYVPDQGERLYRRSLYVYWKRTSPHPMMTLFDAPDRESSCVRRSRTTTALQSLGMLNETQRIEMARKLAERLIGEFDNDSDRLRRLFRMVACRAPNGAEQTVCEKLISEMRNRYQADQEGATQLLSTGNATRDETQDPIEQAAWTQLAATVLASDISIMLY